MDKTKKMKRYRRLAMILLILSIVAFTPKVNAELANSFEVFDGEEGVKDGKFYPHNIYGVGQVVYCMEHGTSFNATLPRTKYKDGDVSNRWCSACNSTPSKPWSGTKTSLRYTRENQIDEASNQDAAYVLATAVEENRIFNMDIQYALWTTGVNLGRVDSNDGNGLGTEAVNYKNFYNTIHDENGRDTFTEQLKNNTSMRDFRVQVNRTEKNYIVGPLKVQYPNGQYEKDPNNYGPDGQSGLNLWSMITNLSVIDQGGNVIADMLSNNLEVLDSNGNRIYVRNYNPDTKQIEFLNLPKNNSEFYVRFKANSDTTNAEVKADFKYLESCSAEMYEYNGKSYNWTWNTEGDGTHGHTKKHKYTGEDGKEHTSWKTVQKKKYKHVLSVTEGSHTQKLLSYVGQGKKNYKTTSIILNRANLNPSIPGNPGNPGNPDTPNGFDITMKISGQVFLDQGEGKNNTGNNLLDNDEKLAGVEVTLYDENGEKVNRIINANIYHQHTGSSTTGGGCYTQPVNHVHSGDATTGGGCYTKIKHEHTASCYQSVNHKHGSACYTVPIYHTHIGNADVFGGCYQGTPIYHTHSPECYEKCDGTMHQFYSQAIGDGKWLKKYLCDKCNQEFGTTEHDQPESMPCNVQTNICGKEENVTIDGYETNCGKEEDVTIDGYDLGCGKTEDSSNDVVVVCGETELYERDCGKQEGSSIDYYLPTCGNSTDSVTGTTSNALQNPTLTDGNGYYEFSGLDAQKKYYVKFTYNGMLYENVIYTDDNGVVSSKATEDAQGQSNNRKDFNSLFSEIGSYPANYKIKHKIFNDIGDYNRTYLQEDIADFFQLVSRTIVEKGGDENAAYHQIAQQQGNSAEIKRMLQFVADCRISSYTVKQYPLTDKFIIYDTRGKAIGADYSVIYTGIYDQTHVNLGIKTRPTFDMALYKDVFNAVVEINGKSEKYEYDERRDTEHKGFNVGVNESDYLNQLREKYLKNKSTNLKTKEVQKSEEYVQEIRAEEIINGNNANPNINADTLYDNDNNYAWRDLNYGLSQQDKMKIHVTYKLSVKNQSGVKGSVTELVDYYDNNYHFEGAYVGDEDGNKMEGTNVEVSDTSMYANRHATQSPSNTMYGTDGKYKTIYLRPSEQKLGSSEEQYIYVTFGLIDPETTLVNAKLMDGQKLYTYNLAEINGYRTYSEGLIDRDSNPGNFNVAEYERGVTALEDDENQAPAFIYSKRYSRTVEGTVFEDTITSPKNANEVATKQARFGSATIDEKDTPIKDVIVELVEIKQVGEQKQLIVRQATRTDEKGWYGFGALLPGDYVVRYTYGSDNQTAMTTTTPNIKGSNQTSYNGQDYQATTYNTKDQEVTSQETYGVDDILTQRYSMNSRNKNTEEKTLTVEGQKITKYTNNGYYWYNDSTMVNRSDAYDDIARKSQVIDYSKNEYGREIVNHKAEVFNSYQNPQPEHITKELHAKLVSELERRTYRYAYTAEMPVEIEYTTKTINGNQDSNHYTYKITGVDFGVVERPKAKLELTKNIDHIKVTTADGTVLFDTNKGVNNLSWTVRKDRYKKVPVTQIIMDDELISGSKLEITYKFTVTNTSEIDENGNSTTRAKKIIDYVANNLTYTKEDANNNLWQVVNKEDIQNEKNSTLINNTQNGKYKLIDLSTKQTILQTTESNPLTKALKAGESTSATLVLKKVLSAESSTDDLTYRNIAEIVEVDNTVGRYDHSAVPGNQLPDAAPTEDDTFEAETIVVLPPFGSQPVYYVIGIIAAVILAGGIYLIKKKVIDR